MDVVSACRFAGKISKTPPPTFLERYGRGRLNELANCRRRNLNCKGLGALDLRTTRPDGTAWGFRRKQHREDALAMVMMTKPKWVIGSPPCTAWCAWNWHINYRKLPAHNVHARISERRLHLDFMMQIYNLQRAGGRYFLHEHPATAVSWDEPDMVRLTSSPDVYSTVAHQCEYGLTTPNAHGEPVPVLKPTRWVSTSKWMIMRLSKRCNRQHQHLHLEGKTKTRNAEVYPNELCIEIRRGIRDTEDAAFHHDDEDDLMLNHAIWVQSLQRDGEPGTGDRNAQTSMHNDHATPHHDADKHPTQHILDSQRSPDMQTDIDKTHTHANNFVAATTEKTRTNTLKHYGGETSQICVETWKPKYVDEYTQETLPMDLAQDAMYNEIEYFANNVIEIIGTNDIKTFKDPKSLGGRWVSANKSDQQNPKVRCRYVATDCNQGDTNADFYAATPPLECERLLFSQRAKRRKSAGPELALMFLDVTNAYFNATPKRNLFIRLPKEMGLPPHCVGRLLKCAYGTRDAGALWEDTYAAALTSIGLTRGKASPCCFVRKARNISIVVHGDDFTLLGLRSDLLWVRDKLVEKSNLATNVCSARSPRT